jgi:hypothetical protein
MTPEKKSSAPHHHNLRSKSIKGTPQRTLHIKGKSITTKPLKYESNHKLPATPDEIGPFATERINLPRGKLKRSSNPSSACNSQSPLKLPRALAG